MNGDSYLKSLDTQVGALESKQLQFTHADRIKLGRNRNYLLHPSAPSFLASITGELIVQQQLMYPEENGYQCSFPLCVE